MHTEVMTECLANHSTVVHSWPYLSHASHVLLLLIVSTPWADTIRQLEELGSGGNLVEHA